MMTTVGDYTVMGKISSNVWDTFKNENYNKDGILMMHFEDNLTFELEKWIYKQSTKIG